MSRCRRHPRDCGARSNSTKPRSPPNRESPMYEFEYQKPASLDDVTRLLGDEDAKLVARGTTGGSIANNDPAADYPAAVVALNATVRTKNREIAADQFFTGMFETALQPGEILTAVRFPKVAQANYQKFRNPASRYAIVGVFVAKTQAGVRVAVTGAGASVFRVPEMEAALAKSFTPDAIKDIAIKDDGLNSD